MSIQSTTKTTTKALISISSYSTAVRKKKPLEEIHNELANQITDNSRAESSKFFVDANKRRLSSAGARLVELSQIKGPTGSVRGHKNVVRKSVENIKVASSSSQRFGSASTSADGASNQTNDNKNNINGNTIHEQVDEEYVECLRVADEEICVAYVTSLGVIRRTFDDSKRVRSILELNAIKFDERDIYISEDYKRQLRARCGKTIKVLPALFINGCFFGGLAELEAINEYGRLRAEWAHFRTTTRQSSLSLFLSSSSSSDMQFPTSLSSSSLCACCGNAKYIACQHCHGSRKSAVLHFKYSSVALKCVRCDSNDGLVKCPVCCGDGGSGGDCSNVSRRR